MKKKSLLILCVTAAVVAALAFLMLRSHVEYQMMSYGEQLKAQLYEERHIRSKELFERVEVQRPWYSLSPADWTFAVTFAGGETVYYRRVNRTFVPCG